MPCDTIRKPNETREQRIARVTTALRRLEVGLTSRTITVVISREGAVAFKGWSDESREGVTDVCAYRALTKMRSGALAQAIKTAQLAYGRPVNEQQVLAGVHSHDGGVTWGRH